MTLRYWIIAGVFVAGMMATLLWQNNQLKDEITELEAQLAVEKMSNNGLQETISAMSLQQESKDEEFKQTNEMLDQCYKKIASQANELAEIEDIMKLPTLGEINVPEGEGHADQDQRNSATIDFLNNQLRNVK